MRHLLFSLLFLPVADAWAQDYQLVRSDMVRFYGIQNFVFYGIRIDSVAVEDGDNILYNYLTLRTGSTYFGSCYYVNAPSIIGRKVVMRENGETLLFNRKGDTLTVLTQAALQDTWPLMSIGIDSFLRATVSDISQQEWLGITDMVKTITIQAVDDSGQDIEHPANGSELLIGQQLGLLRGFDLFYFPYMEGEQYNHLDVLGMEEHGAGMRRVSTAELYDLDLCDEFHFRKTTTGNVSGPPDDTYTKRTIISKSISNDSVTYQFETYGCRYHYEYMGWSSDPPYIHTITPIEPSIITRQYPFKWDAHEVLMPGEQVVVDVDSIEGPDYLEYYYELRIPQSIGLYANRMSLSNSGLETVGLNHVIYPVSQDCELGYMDCDCWGELTPTMEGYQSAVGLGRVREISGYFYGYQDWERRSNDLVYYNKCGEEWGNPISEGLLTGVGETARRQPLTVHPNPTSSILRFDSPSNTTYTVTDATGRAVMHGQAQQGQNTLSVDGLRDGMYVLRLEDGSGAVRFVKTGQ